MLVTWWLSWSGCSEVPRPRRGWGGVWVHLLGVSHPRGLSPLVGVSKPDELGRGGGCEYLGLSCMQRTDGPRAGFLQVSSNRSSSSASALGFLARLRVFGAQIPCSSTTPITRENIMLAGVKPLSKSILLRGALPKPRATREEVACCVRRLRRRARGEKRQWVLPLDGAVSLHAC